MRQENTELTKMALEVQKGQGDFDGLILKWSNKIKLDGWVRNKTISSEDSKDLKQEVLINIFERITEFNSDLGNFETWAWNRCRQVVRSWIRKAIREKHPLVGKRSKKKGITPSPATFISYEDWSTEADIICYDEFYEVTVDEIKMAINDLPMAVYNRQTTIETFKLLADNCPRKEIMETLGISGTKLNCNIKRIKKAITLLEEAKQDEIYDS